MGGSPPNGAVGATVMASHVQDSGLEHPAGLVGIDPQWQGVVTATGHDHHDMAS